MKEIKLIFFNKQVLKTENFLKTHFFPNPYKNNAYIITDKTPNLIEVFDLFGNDVYSQNSTKLIDTSILPTRNYIVKTTIESEINFIKTIIMKRIYLLLLVVLGIVTSCKNKDNSQVNVNKQKTGLLLVNHGSRSETWRNALLDLEKNVAPEILKDKKISGIKTAFMEYTEPSIATRLKEFDKEGFTDIIIVPIFLTVSPHTFEDIPTIIGQKEDKKSFEMMKLENIERYVPKAKTHIAPLLDFSDVLQKNVLRRVQQLSRNPSEEGLVLIGYGDEDYEKEWTELFNKVAEYVKAKMGIDTHSQGWCGHIAGYKSSETTEAINKVLKREKYAVVIPVLVAHDENFQIEIIGGGIKGVKENKDKVLYKPDAILPDDNVKNWVIAVSKEFANKIETK